MQKAKRVVKPKVNPIKAAVYSHKATEIDTVIDNIATICDVTPNTVYRWMRDITQVKTVYKPLIAKALKIKVDTLF